MGLRIHSQQRTVLQQQGLKSLPYPQRSRMVAATRTDAVCATASSAELGRRRISGSGVQPCQVSITGDCGGSTRGTVQRDALSVTQPGLCNPSESVLTTKFCETEEPNPRQDSAKVTTPPDMAHKEAQNASVQHSSTGGCNGTEINTTLSTFHGGMHQNVSATLLFLAQCPPKKHCDRQSEVWPSEKGC